MFKYGCFEHTGTLRSAVRPANRWLLLLTSFAIAACDSPAEQTSAEARAGGEGLSLSAYRVRTDAAASLNGDSWAGALNTPVTVQADQPFRLRVEVENRDPTINEHQFSLQYRRNEGDWQTLGADDFPYPTREVTLDFSAGPEAKGANKLRLEQGSSSGLSWRGEAGDSYLQLDSGTQPLLALGDYHTYWEAEEFKVQLRLGESAEAGLLFGYQDADNHYRLLAQGAGPISLVQRSAGHDQIIDTLDVTVKADQWIELALVREDNEISIEYEWDPIIEGLEWRREMLQPLPASVTGLYLPAQSRADLRALEISADAYSPRASIVSTTAYSDGAETRDLLDGTNMPFVAGAGINLAPVTPPWSAARAQGEWEFPIVLRYFADGAVTNQHGDRFEFRLLDAAGSPVSAAQLPAVTLQVPDGHLGGTFVETPGRLGPWQSSDGSLYFLMEPSETDNMMMIVKSEDGGKHWQEVDGGQRPDTGDLEGVATAFDGERIHILHQTSDDVLYHVFRTSAHAQPDSWEIRDEHLASPTEPPVQVADLALLSDGSVVAVYGDLHKLRYRLRSAEGEWSAATIIDPDAPRDLSGPVVVRGANDVVHLAYTGFDGTAWYRRVLPNGDMTSPQLVARGLGTAVEDAGGILPLVYLPESNSVSIVYRLDNGELWERRAGGELSAPVQVTSRAVARNAADSEQVGADTLGFGEQVHVLFIEEATGRLFHSWRDAAGAWAEPKLAVDGENVLWVRGALIKRADGGSVYGFVYDGGSQGGSGMNRYLELPLPPADQGSASD